MTENLDLALTEGLELNPDNTDIGETWVVAEDEVSISEPDGPWGTGSSWNDNTRITPEEIDTVRSYNGNSSRGTRAVATNDTIQSNSSLDGSNLVNPVETQSIGTYYNWYTATAKSGTTDLTNDGLIVDNSVCPKGWRLPDYSNTKSFRNLIDIYNSNSKEDLELFAQNRSFPLSFVYSGTYNWYQGRVDGHSSQGLWWSSVVADFTRAYDFNISSSPSVAVKQARTRAYGLPVRCVNK